METNCQNCEHEHLSGNNHPCDVCILRSKKTGKHGENMENITEKAVKYSFSGEIQKTIREGKSVWILPLGAEKWEKVDQNFNISISSVLYAKWALEKPKELVKKSVERWVSDECIHDIEFGNGVFHSILPESSGKFKRKITISWESEQGNVVIIARNRPFATVHLQNKYAVLASTGLVQ